MNSSIFIPKKCKVGFNRRNDTYTKKLGYVIYHDGKIWRKEASWKSWIEDYVSDEDYQKAKDDQYRDKIQQILSAKPQGDGKCKINLGYPKYWVTFDKIETRSEAEALLQYDEFQPAVGKRSNDPGIKPIIFENVAMEGFVLNKKVGGTKYGWNSRNTYCRVYDPRGFEFEISIPNLLYILENANSIKGKGLEGKFIYGWSGKDLVLIPESAPEFKDMLDYTKLQHGKVLKKDLIVGGIYLNSKNERLTYLGDAYEKYSYNHLSSKKKLWFSCEGKYDKNKIHFITYTSVQPLRAYSDENNDDIANILDVLEKQETYYKGEPIYQEIELNEVDLLRHFETRNSNYYFAYIKQDGNLKDFSIHPHHSWYNDGYDVHISGNIKEHYKTVGQIVKNYNKVWELKTTK